MTARQDGWWGDQLGDESLPRFNQTKPCWEGSKKESPGPLLPWARYHHAARKTLCYKKGNGKSGPPIRANPEAKRKAMTNKMATAVNGIVPRISESRADGESCRRAAREQIII
jgi:hypothetical protein